MDTPIPPTLAPEPCCSFCAKPQSGCLGLVSGGDASSICDECVLACVSTLAQSLMVPQSSVLQVLQYRHAIKRSAERQTEALAEASAAEAAVPDLAHPNG